jgi:hypothetical protein
MTDRRTKNGRKPHDLSALIGTRYGDRRIIRVDWKTNANGESFQVLVVLCPCGYETWFPPSRLRAAITECRGCRGTGVATHAQPAAKRSYEDDVGSMFGSLRVIAYEVSTRPTFTLQCSAAHTFQRLAWEVVNGRHACQACAGRQQAITPRRNDIGPAEVCSCQWFDGCLKVLCAEHRRSA